MNHRADSKNNLDTLWEEIWASLAQGADSPSNPFGTPVFSSAEKDRVDSRIIILRKVDNKKRVLICHSDVRAKKVQQLKLSPEGSWLFWHAEDRVQIRIRTECRIHHLDGVAKAAWAELSPSSKTNYSVSRHPGEEIPSPEIGIAAYDRNMSPDEETEAVWFQHFAVIVSEVREIEWLCLSRAGHRRARFIISDQGVDNAWIVP